MIVNALNTGGAEKQFIAIARALRREVPVDVFVLAGLAIDAGVEAHVRLAQSEGVAFHSLRTVKAMLRLVTIVCAVPAILWPWGYRAEAVACGVGIVARPARRLSSLRSAYSDGIRKRRWLWRVVDLYCDFYVSNSRRNVEIVEKYVGPMRRRSQIIYNVIGLSATSTPFSVPATRPSRFRVAMLGNIRSHAKGYDLVPAIVAGLLRGGVPVQFLIAGYDYEGGQLAQTIAENGLNDSVRLVGAVARPAEFLSQCHAYLLMSRYEGQPNALLEAMALGMPAVATTVGDIGELMSNREHLLKINIGRVDEAVAALLWIWHNWSDARDMGVRGQGFVRRSFGEAAFGESSQRAMRQWTKSYDVF